MLLDFSPHIFVHILLDIWFNMVTYQCLPCSDQNCRPSLVDEFIPLSRPGGLQICVAVELDEQPDCEMMFQVIF